jgi:hypothetical protein
MRKKILILISSPFVTKNILHSQVFTLLMGETQHDFVILVPMFRKDYFEKLFIPNTRVSVEGIPDDALNNRFNFWYQFLIYNSLPTKTVKIKQYNAFHEGLSLSVFPRRLLMFVVSRMLWYLGKFQAFRTLLAKAYLLIAPRRFEYLFNKYNLELVYLPTLLHTIDLNLIYEAKKNRIPTVGTILSWDNLTSKLSLPIPPDAIGVPNAGIKADLLRFNPVKEENAFITGYPQYDAYFNKTVKIISREEYCRQNRLNPSKKIILYAMAGSKNMPHDFHIISKLREAILRGEIPNSQILISPYPKYSLQQYIEQKLDDNENVIFGDPIVSNIGGKWEMTEEDVAKLANLVYHSDVVITVGSTILIESAILQRPSINIAFDEESPDYYLSPVRFLDYEHIDRLNPYLFNVFSFNELKSKIVEILEDGDNGDIRFKQRSIVENQCGDAAGVSSRAIASLVKRYLPGA